MSGVERKFQLKLSNGRTVEWTGVDDEDAARRYVDAHRDDSVIATRPADRHGIFVLGRGARITP